MRPCDSPPHERRRERLDTKWREELSVGPPRPKVGGHSAMVGHSVADSEHARDQRRTARKTRDIGGVDVSEAEATPCQGIDIGTRVAVVAVTAEMIGAQCVDIEIDNPQKCLRQTIGSLER